MQHWSRRDFVSASGTGVLGAAVVGPRSLWPDERAMARAERRTDSFALLRREQRDRRSRLPEPADFHRLPLSWYKDKVRQLKSAAADRGVDSGIFLTRRWNIIYATGLFHSTTERPFACFLPMDEDDALIWLNPYLDQQLVNDWWTTDSNAYFDYHHAADGFPSQGQVVQGDTVNLYRWWGETLDRLGYGGGTIGLDSGGLAEIGVLPGQENATRLDMWGEIDVPEKKRPEAGSFGEMAAAMPNAWFVDINDIMIRNRIVKDEMENRLTQLAEDYWSEIHAFARNYLLERGLEAVDWEVANAARLWGTSRIMQDIPQDGEPHGAVGISVGVGCRTGRTTAYPHPNQMFWRQVQPVTHFRSRASSGSVGTEASCTARFSSLPGPSGSSGCGRCTPAVTRSRLRSPTRATSARTSPRPFTITRSRTRSSIWSTTAPGTERGWRVTSLRTTRWETTR